MGIWDIGKDDEWVLTLALLAMIYLQDLALNKKTAHMYKKAGGPRYIVPWPSGFSFRHHNHTLTAKPPLKKQVFV